MRLAGAIPPLSRASDQVLMIPAKRVCEAVSRQGWPEEVTARFQQILATKANEDVISSLEGNQQGEEEEQEEEEEDREERQERQEEEREMNDRLIRVAGVINIPSRVPSNPMFPNSLIQCPVPDHLMYTPYGLRSNELPIHVQGELDSFIRWSTSPINIQRGTEYSPSQTHTIAKHMDSIRAFMGFIAIKLGRNLVGLHEYWNPETIATFVSFLLARNCGKGHVIKHLAIARKVNKYLLSTCMHNEEKEHAGKVEQWLSTLERQVRQALPKPIKNVAALPKASQLRLWTTFLKEAAMEALREERGNHERSELTKDTAQLVS